MSIAIIGENPVRAAILESGLREAGHWSITRIGETTDLLARIWTLDPDVIFIDLENPSRDVLERMFQVSRSVRRPVAMFVDQADFGEYSSGGRRGRERVRRRRAA